MKIDSLIDRNYYSVSILEDTEQVARWLSESEYFAVIDEESEVVGLITRSDICEYPHQQVIDCDIFKPPVTPDSAMVEVVTLMKNARVSILPVYSNTEFVGVITLLAITERLIEIIKNA